MEKCPEKEDTDDSSPKDTHIDHTSIVSTIDFVQILAGADIVFARYLSVGVSPMMSNITTIGKVLDMSSFHYANDDRMKESSVKRSISI